MQDDIPPAEAAEFSRAFNLYVTLDEVKVTAARLRAAADRTTGLECEANIRLAEAAEAEIARIEAELEALKALHQGKDPPAESAGPHEVVSQGRQRQQERDILEALRTLGYNPLQLPRPPAGTPGPKAGARAALPKMTPKQFDKAWDRLRGFRDIQDAE